MEQPYDKFTNIEKSDDIVDNGRVIYARYPRRVSGILAIICGIISLIFAVVISALMGHVSCILLVGIWASIMLVLSGAFGIQASKTGNKCPTVTCLVLSIVAIVLAAGGLMSATKEYGHHRMGELGHHGHHGHHHHHHHHHHGNRTSSEETSSEEHLPNDEKPGAEMQEAEPQRGEEEGEMMDKDWGRKRSSRKCSKMIGVLMMAEMGVFFIGFIVTIIQSGLGCASTCKCCKNREEEPKSVYVTTIPETLSPKAIEAGYTIA